MKKDDLDLLNALQEEYDKLEKRIKVAKEYSFVVYVEFGNYGKESLHRLGNKPNIDRLTNLVLAEHQAKLNSLKEEIDKYIISKVL